jgi:hypothetical protein
MNNYGASQAIKTLTKSGLTDLLDFPLEDLIFSLVGGIKEEPIVGAEGRIIFSHGEAIITVNSSITLLGKKRFVLAHELGHFIMHKEKLIAHIDNDQTLNDWYKNGPHELEANSFAKELLMPEVSFKPLAQGKFSMGQIEGLAVKFQTSKTATLLRYKDLGSYPIALIFIDGGIVKWTQYSADFVLQYIPKDSKLPVNTVAGDIFYRKNSIPDEPEIVDAIDWFPEDFNIKKYQKWKFKEQCFFVSKTGILSCLWGY